MRESVYGHLYFKQTKGEKHMSDSYDDYETKIQLAEQAWEKRVDEMVKTEHDKQIEIAQAYERGWNAALAHAAIAQQEPVAFINVEKQKLEWAKLTSWHTPTIVNLPKIPLYTAPPKKEWVGLTDEEKEKLVEAFYGTDIQRLEAIEAKLKEKNG
jgi:UDP:flavonoid glycosyltransferase YjiC (YdhE family)